MSPYLLIPLSLALLVGVLWLVNLSAERLQVRAEIQRKSIHVALGIYCLAFPFLFDRPWEVALLCFLAMALLLILRLRHFATAGLGRGLHAVGRQSYGEILFTLSVAVLFYLKGDSLVLYLLPMAILTLADAAAALVGSSYGRRLFTIEEGQKSFEGVVFFFLLAWIIAVGMLLHFSDVARENVIPLGLIVAFFGASIEAESWRGWDNLFIPLGLYFLLVLQLDAQTLALLGVVAIYAAILLALLWLAPRLGIDRHAARVAAIVFFFIWMTATAESLITPVAVFLCHLLLQKRKPDAEGFPHLVALLCIVVTALFWYVAGQASNASLFYLFNLSLGCLAAGLFGFAFQDRKPIALAGASLIWGASTLSLWWVGDFDRADRIFVGAAFAVFVLAATLVPKLGDYLRTQRYPKLAVGSVLVALAFLPVARL